MVIVAGSVTPFHVPTLVGVNVYGVWVALFAGFRSDAFVVVLAAGEAGIAGFDVYGEGGQRVAEVCGGGLVAASRGPLLCGSDDGGWTVAVVRLVAWCRLRGDIRWFNLSRIQSATATRHLCTGHDFSEVGTPPEQARPVGV